MFQVDGGLHQNPDGTYEGGGGANVNLNFFDILCVDFQLN